MIPIRSGLDFYSNAINNKAFLVPVNLPSKVVVYYSILLTYCPLSEKKKTQYTKLDPNKKAGFLFKHLLKCAYHVNVPKPLIEDLISTKNKYDSIQKSYKNENLDNNTLLIEKIKKSSLNDMIDDVETMLEKSNLVKSFEEKIGVMTDSIYYNTSRENKRKKKLEEIFDINK
jgi:CRISPR/Cas system CSM-associated protein Csm2 small subunit